MKVGIVGASGFIGGAVWSACEREGLEIVPISAPRLRTEMRTRKGLELESESDALSRAQLTNAMMGAEVVVNAAGIADAVASDLAALVGANGLLPGLIAKAASQAGVTRFVHISSAAVQGRRACLDDSCHWDPFSPYAKSKILGEQVAMSVSDIPTVLYRPTSVHGPGREVTRSLARIARSPLASVAGDGERPTPQILDRSVGSAVTFIVSSHEPPPIVTHPWEGVTTAGLLRSLSTGREPCHVPAAAARILVSALSRGALLRPGMTGLSRRLEMLWFGQAQAESWLTRAGWETSGTAQEWRKLGADLADQTSRS